MARTRRTAPWLALLPALAPSACGDGAETVVVSGSSTVEPIDVPVAEELTAPLPESEVSPEVGYVALSDDEDLAEARARWDARTTGAA